MPASPFQRHFVAVMAKHLPPASSSLRLLDLDGDSGAILAQSRADLAIRHIPPENLSEAEIAPDSIDAIVAYNLELSDELLASCLRALRPGGRFIATHSRAAATQSHLRQLRAHGYVRILIEPALDELGLLTRGEKAHATSDAVERIQSVARADADSLDPSRFKGRYIHLLIQQRPNKPVWKLAPGDEIRWRAAALTGDPGLVTLGFSSLPKAVAFLQGAVLAGFISDINKVGKFSRATALAQAWDIRLNPTLESLTGETLAFVDINPALAEAPDE